MNSIKSTIQKFLYLEKKEFHRFNSWKNCYQYFQNSYFKDKGDDDTAALHLGFYLASWGMYRGSTFLLQNDYKIHTEVVRLIKEYNSKKISDLNILVKSIVDYYKNNAHKNSKDSNESSDTLITKILLGTLGNTPAYDRFFIEGITLHNKNNPSKKIHKNFSTKNLSQLNKFYLENINEFKEFENEFPPMKLIDMYFWKLGFDNE